MSSCVLDNKNMAVVYSSRRFHLVDKNKWVLIVWYGQ